MIQLFNKLIKRYLKYRYPRIVYFRDHPHQAQQKVLQHILNTSTKCSYTRDLGVGKNIKDFKLRTPIVEYNAIKPHVEAMLTGKRDVLAPGFVKWFSKSSGTSENRSKYIPVTDAYHPPLPISAHCT